MKRISFIYTMAMAFIFSVSIQAQTQNQSVKTVSLEQTDGTFTQKSITLDEGTYVFEIANNGVDHEVGFVLAPEGKIDEAITLKKLTSLN